MIYKIIKQRLRPESSPLTLAAATDVIINDSYCLRDMNSVLSVKVAKILNSLPIQKMLVVGNALPMLPYIMLLLGKEVLYVDMDPSVIRYGEVLIKTHKELYKKRLNYQGLVGVFGNGVINTHNIPLHSFDAVIMADLLGPVPQGGVNNWFKELDRLLTKRSYLLIDTFHMNRELIDRIATKSVLDGLKAMQQNPVSIEADTDPFHTLLGNVPFRGYAAQTFDDHTVLENMSRYFPQHNILLEGIQGTYNDPSSRNTLFEVNHR